jgi:hypothetical protein
MYVGLVGIFSGFIQLQVGCGRVLCKQLGLARTTYKYGVYTVFLAKISPDVGRDITR